jgi:phage-related protein (TIGR01555 family)
MPWFDTLQNWISGLMMSSRDKTTGLSYFVDELTPEQLEAAYRGDWLARKIIEIPAFDSTREWRNWQAKQKQIEQLEEIETKFNVRSKVRETLLKSRLYGGAGIVIGVVDKDMAEPLEVDRLKQGDLKFLHVVTRYELSNTDGLEDDIMSPWYGIPRTYSVRTSAVARTGMMETRIHPSRIVRFVGNDPPNAIKQGDGWGDSILIAVNDAVRNSGLTAQSIAQMIQEAKVDFVKVPDLTKIMGKKDSSDRYIKRFAAVNSTKSITNAVMFDKDEEWNRTQLSFAGMPEVMQAYLLIACGAADIPATRLLGRSPAGMNATGESDVRNYYDRIKSEQEMRIRPALDTLDKVLQASALGAVDDNIYYEWAPLWQMDEEQKSKINFTNAQATKIYVESGVVPFEALSKGVQNQLIEAGDYPGLEAAIQEANAAGDFTGEPLPLMIAKTKPKLLPAPNGGGGNGGGQSQGDEWDDPVARHIAAFRDRDLKPLFVQRKLKNVRELRAWALKQGISDIVKDPHVTVLYSKRPVDWIEMGQPLDEEITVQAGGPRTVERLGDTGAIVLHFASTSLQYRHEDMIARGASHDYGEYQPHVTITYDPEKKIDVAAIEPYRGKLAFGPEIHEGIQTDDSLDARGRSKEGSMSSGPYRRGWELEAESEWYQYGNRKRRRSRRRQSEGDEGEGGGGQDHLPFD